MKDTPVHKRTFRYLVAPVSLVVTTVSAWLGAVAPLLYHNEASPHLAAVGSIAGAISGLATAVFWCAMMSRRTERQIAHKGGTSVTLAAWGLLWGVISGVISTVLVHVCMMTAVGLSDLDRILAGLVFGIPVGFLLGLVLGVIWFIATRVLTRSRTSVETDAAQ